MMRSPVALPTSVDGVFEALDVRPDATMLAGGTDLMVQVNFGERTPRGVIALRRVDELKRWRADDDAVLLGPLLTFRQLQDLQHGLPAVAAASRTVGSPPIRNRGTLGGNIVTSSPAGDLLPPLLALDATVDLMSPRRRRSLPLKDFLVGPKRNALEPGEILIGIRVPKVRGPQQFLKVGPRNAMVISVASLALVIDRERMEARCALGSVGPTPLRATHAERLLTDHINWRQLSIHADAAAEFARLAAEEARPITDKRSSDQYRRHSVQVLALRAIERSVSIEPGKSRG